LLRNDFVVPVNFKVLQILIRRIPGESLVANNHATGYSLFSFLVWDYKIIFFKNALILATLIVLLGIISHFFSGNYTENRLEGTWRAPCIQETITFCGNTYIRGRETGEFNVKANVIYFGANCTGYSLKISSQYLCLNGVYYFRV